MNDPRDQEQEPEWLPYNIEAEQALLGAILLNNDALHRVSATVLPEHFHEALHGHLFQVMSQLIDAGKRADPILLRTFITDHMLVGTGMTVNQYIARLAAASTTIVNALDYAKVVRELADRRMLWDVASTLTPNDATQAAALATDAIERLDAVVSANLALSQRAVSMREAVSKTVQGIADAYSREEKISGVATHLADLDAKMHGWEPGDLIIVAGRPGMGKSAFMTTVMRFMGEHGVVQRAQSLEMSDESLTQRMISDKLFIGGQVPYSNLRSGEFHERVFDRVVDAGTDLAELPITIDPGSGLNLSQIAARARQHKRRHGLQVLWIDHLDLIRSTARYAGNRTYEISEITSGLKALAKELGIVIVLLSQLSRDVEKRDDKRPMLSDLRSSGSIEQDADSVIFLYRPSYYLENREPPPGTEAHQVWERESLAAVNKLLCIIGKQRGGAVGTIELFCNVACNAVRNWNWRELP